MSYNSGKSHPKFIDLSGKKIGNLSVMEYLYFENRKEGNRWLWLCECDCGETCGVRTSRLTKDNPQTSCKRCADKRSSSARILPDSLSSKHRAFRRYKQGAKEREYEFHITFEEFLEIISKDCYYCASKPKKYSDESYERNGIDRMDNSKGYTLNNVVTCCSICNRLKMDLSYDDFKLWIGKVYTNLTNKSSTTIPSGSTSQANGDGKGDPSKEVMI